MNKIVIFFLLVFTACADNTNVIKDGEGNVMYSVYEETVNKLYSFRFLESKALYQKDFTAENPSAIKRGFENKLEIYYKDSIAYTDSSLIISKLTIKRLKKEFLINYAAKGEEFSMKISMGANDITIYKTVVLYKGMVKLDELNVERFELTPRTSK